MKSQRDPEPMYISSMMDLMIIFVVSFVGLAINWKCLKDMDRDDKMRPPGTNQCLIKDVLTTFIKVTMVLSPFYLFFFWFLNEDYELPTWFQYILCYDQYVTTTARIYYSFNSLVIATMRYTYIVHNERVLRFGKDRAKAIFYYGSILIPFLLGVLNAFSVQTPRNIHNAAQSICIDFYLDSLNITIKDTDNIPGFGSPILFFAHQYFPVFIIVYLDAFLTVFGLLIFSNVIEGILYWKTFGTLRR